MEFKDKEETQIFKKWHEIDDQILKNGASKKKLQSFCDDAAVDYVFIGSGLGSLTLASILSKVGYRVLILEQHDVAGGATHSFEERGFEWDVGLHYVGDNLNKFYSISRRIFDLVSDGALEWSLCDEPYDIAIDAISDTRIHFGANHEKTNKAIAKTFHQDIQAIYRFRRACFWARLVALASFFAKALPKPLARLWLFFIGPAYRWAWCRDTTTVAKNCGLSTQAAGCLTYLYGDYGVQPNQAPFALHALLDSHYAGGAFYPRGGAKSIAKTIITAIHRTNTKSQVFVRAPVTAILRDNHNKAIGVSCKEVDIKVRHGVVSNAGAINTFHYLLHHPSLNNNASVKDTLAQLGIPSAPSVALFYLFVGLEGTKQQLGLAGNNLWISQGFNHDQNWHDLYFAEQPPEDFSKLPTCFLSAGSAKDDAHSIPTTTVQLLVPVLNKWFNQWANTKLKHRGSDYDSLKAKFRDTLLESFLFRFFPKTKNNIKHTVLATPLTTEFYLNAQDGASYGLNHDLNRFSKSAQLALHTQTHIPRLYLVGQDHLCVGIVGALMSGVLATLCISKLQPFEHSLKQCLYIEVVNDVTNYTTTVRRFLLLLVFRN